jgi:hypothetical protein
MNCSLFRVVFQRFFRMNRNSGICVWDLLCLLVFLSRLSSTNPTNIGGELRCSGRVSSSCSTSDSRRVNLVTNPRFPKQVLLFHSCINCFRFIPINNTDADLVVLHCITNCYLIYQVALTVHADKN